MAGYDFNLGPAALTARPSGALHWPAASLLVVSDLHLGKSGRMARRGGSLLPPYETRETLRRLQADLAESAAERVICLGDSFDDSATHSELERDDLALLAALMTGRDWTWIEGNHDPGPVSCAPGGHSRAELHLGGLVFRHIAAPETDTRSEPEVSGHYHPKARLAGQSLRCFLLSPQGRLILPAYGAYTGGLGCEAAVLRDLMAPGAIAILTGQKARAIPFADAAAPRGAGRAMTRGPRAVTQ